MYWRSTIMGNSATENQCFTYMMNQRLIFQLQSILILPSIWRIDQLHTINKNNNNCNSSWYLCQPSLHYIFLLMLCILSILQIEVKSKVEILSLDSSYMWDIDLIWALYRFFKWYRWISNVRVRRSSNRNVRYYSICR